MRGVGTLAATAGTGSICEGVWMALIDELVEIWLKAGVVDQPTAARIRAFESSRSQPPERPGVLEAVIYLAVAVIGVGVAVLIGTNWEHLNSAARIAIPSAAAIGVLAGGFRLMKSPLAELRRGGQAAWFLAVALLTAATAVIVVEADGSETMVAVATATVTLLSAIGCWAASRTHLQVLAIAGAVGYCGISAIAVVDASGGEQFSLAFGGTVLALSIAAIIAIELNVLVPRVTARLLAAAGLVVGAFNSAIPPAPAVIESITFIVATAIMALSIRRGVFIYMAAGVALFFVGLATVIVRHAPNATFAALAFIVSGLALLAITIMLERFRPWHRPARVT